jgi:hypothetical protein
MHYSSYCALGLAILSALVTFFFIAPLDHDGMAKEDAIVRFSALMCACTYGCSLQFREYLEENGFDTSGMGFVEIESQTSSVPEELDEKEKDPIV